MVFKLIEGAQKTWRRLDAHYQLPQIIRAVKFTDGREVIAKPGYLQAQTATA
jgi:putative transposase